MKRKKPVNNLYIILLAMTMVFSLVFSGGAIEVRAIAPDPLTEKMSEVYVAPRALGDGTVASPTSWQDAVEKVAPDGTIYIMGDSVHLQTNETYNFENVTIKPYNGGTNNPNNLENILIKIDNGANITFTGTTFDGTGYAEEYNYDMIYVADAILNLGEHTVVKNFINTSYGSTIDVYSGATVNLKGTQIVDNRAGTLSDNACGGVTVSGTLNVDGNTLITRNSLYDTTDNVDIYVFSNGIVNLDGGATVGTIAFQPKVQHQPSTTDKTINVMSALQSPINMIIKRNNYGTLNNVFVTDEILAQGAGGYTLTEQDISRLIIPVNGINNHIAALNSRGEAYVARQYSTTSRAIENGKLKLSSEFAIAGKEITITPDAIDGYHYKDGSIKAYKKYGDPDTTGISLMKNEGQNSFKMIMPAFDVWITATFEITLKEPTPAIVIDYFAETLKGFEIGRTYLIDAAEYVADANGTIPAVPQMGRTIQIVLKSDDVNINDSDPQSLVVPGRPAVPTCSAVDTSTASAKDGKIVLATSTSIEYKTEGTGSYTKLTAKEITGLGAGGYHVRFPATVSSFASLNALIHVLSDASIVYEITGAAVDTDDNGIKDAIVELYSGTKLLGRQITNDVGVFTFSNVPDGLYQLVVTFDGVTVTVEAQVKGADTSAGRIVMPAKAKNSIVQLTEKAPELVVNDLPKVYDTAVSDAAIDKGVTESELNSLNSSSNGGITKITIKLTADSKTEETAAKAADIKAEAASNQKTVGSYLDLSMYKEITKNNVMASTKLTEVPNLIKITIPLESGMQGKNGYVIYRYHGGVNTIKEGETNKNGEGEYFAVNPEKTVITLYTRNFSTYAISFDPAKGGGNSGSHGGNSQNTYPITTKPSGSGSITSNQSSALSGETVTVTVKPDAGYTLDKLVVKGADGKEIALKEKGNNGYTFVMPSGAVTVTATFSKAIASLSETGVSKWLITDDHIAYMKGDDRGNFNPKKNMTRAEAAQMFYNLLKEKNVPLKVSFSDVADSSWYAKSVRTLASMDVISGFEGRFRPNDSITRAEFTSIAMRFAKMTDGDRQFSDVAKSNWAYQYIAAAAEYGWVNGYEDNTFRPNNSIARAEVSAIVNHMLDRTPDKIYIDANRATLKIFPDAAESSYWAWYHIVETTNAHQFTKTDVLETWTVQASK